jgi:hypothetical protein
MDFYEPVFAAVCGTRVEKTDAWSREQTPRTEQLFREISMATNEQITPKTRPGSAGI